MSQAKQIDIDALAVGPALDKAVAERVYDYDVRDKAEVYIDRERNWRARDTDKVLMSPQNVPDYSESRDLAAEVEAVIASLGLNTEYMRKLILEVDPLANPESMLLLHWFNVLRATPEQRCRAALRVVMEEYRNERN